jgi:hypothetical protein
LAAQPYFQLFDSQLYFNLHALKQFADDRNDGLSKKLFYEFARALAELQEMLGLFRSTINGTVREVAMKRHWRPATVEIRLDRLGLTAVDFRGENAVLRRLIVRSPVLRPLFDELLSHQAWGAGSADTLQEKRGQ